MAFRDIGPEVKALFRLARADYGPLLGLMAALLVMPVMVLMAVRLPKSEK